MSEMLERASLERESTERLFEFADTLQRSVERQITMARLAVWAGTTVAILECVITALLITAVMQKSSAAVVVGLAGAMASLLPAIAQLLAIRRHAVRSAKSDRRALHEVIGILRQAASLLVHESRLLASEKSLFDLRLSRFDIETDAHFR